MSISEEEIKEHKLFMEGLTKFVFDCLENGANKKQIMAIFEGYIDANISLRGIKI